jgi:hypothetical protein
MVRLLTILALPLLVAASAQQARKTDMKITWKKTVLDTEFRSEGVTVADVNRDGRPDIVAGAFWYEAPNWTPHEIAPPQKFDPATGYSNSFLNFTLDVNRDGWPDQIVIGFPGEKAVWRENPKGKPGHWKEHVITKSACNESPAFGYLLGRNRRPVLVAPRDEKVMAWYEPGPDPTAEWICHTVGLEGQPGVARYAHGMGIGDINGDRRADILTKEGWYQQPADPRSTPWPFVRANLGPDCATMHALDLNGDGLADVVSSSAHGVGVWWYEQRKGAAGPEFVQHLIDDSISQTHAIMIADINGDGLPDLVTGKRFWAHGPTGDINPNDPALLVWYEMSRKGREVSFKRHVIDEDSGVGTQFLIADVNGDGLPDIVTSNKKGVFLFVQDRR